VVEVNLGWRRRIVASVRHGDQRVEGALYHTLLGTRVLRS
jgi:hypothetical protein